MSMIPCRAGVEAAGVMYDARELRRVGLCPRLVWNGGRWGAQAGVLRKVEAVGNRTMKKIFEMAERIKGFLDVDEGRRLYEVGLQAAALGPCLEVGSYCGKSALFLGSACRRSGTVLFSIDHHRGSEEQQPGEEYFDPELFDVRSYAIDTLSFLRRTLQAAGLEESVVPMVCPSEVAAKAWATPLALVFIDGGHAYETVLSDFTCWSRHIMPEGFLLIHDIFPDPADGGQAPYRIYQAAIDSGRFRALPMTKTLGVLQRQS